MGEKARRHQDIGVYRKAVSAAGQLFEASRTFPSNEKYELTSQMRRASRSVCANLAEAWRKRRYHAAFVAKLSDAEAEAAEVQVWLDLAANCRYIPADEAERLSAIYDEILGVIVGMISHPDTWLLRE